jgi:hypothetical protein
MGVFSLGGAAQLNSIVTTGQARQFTVSEILTVPGLNIYEQMVCIVLSTYMQETAATIPDVTELASLGRMTLQETLHALQGLVERKVLPHKVYREIVGDFRDTRLSWTAKGLLVYLEKQPRIQLDELLELSSDDQTTIIEALRQLQSLGYLEEECKRLLAAAV